MADPTLSAVLARLEKACEGGCPCQIELTDEEVTAFDGGHQKLLSVARLVAQNCGCEQGAAVLFGRVLQIHCGPSPTEVVGVPINGKV
ncbi:MAG TPA: hypothetical protein VHZ95_04025 [Polyangiales bacterium]|jgi:hypothetical protein|nr:hypothetical protein [Polyangiales bacterium]